MYSVERDSFSDLFGEEDLIFKSNTGVLKISLTGGGKGGFNHPTVNVQM